MNPCESQTFGSETHYSKLGHGSEAHYFERAGYETHYFIRKWFRNSLFNEACSKIHFYVVPEPRPPLSDNLYMSSNLFLSTAAVSRSPCNVTCILVFFGVFHELNMHVLSLTFGWKRREFTLDIDKILRTSLRASDLIQELFSFLILLARMIIRYSLLPTLLCCWMNALLRKL